MPDAFENLLKECIRCNGSDLHLAANNPPMVRIHGTLRPLQNSTVLRAKEVEETIKNLIGAKEYDHILKINEWDGALSLEDGHRIRINIYRQHNTIAAALRILPNQFFSFDRLGLPINVLNNISGLRSGLVLVTGTTSSGKSTTIASIINKINQECPCHIHTIEDPIEYQHISKKALVTQREIGRDTDSFAEALRRSMREDPDVIVVGEMRDLETMTAALTLAETGHLTFATLHTSSAIQTISRIISAYPANQQAQTRIQLASTLQYILCQKLIPWDVGEGRSLATEILAVIPAVRAMIRDEKTHQILTTMQTNYEAGMRTLNQSLEQLVQQGRINHKTAIQYSEDKKEFMT